MLQSLIIVSGTDFTELLTTNPNSLESQAAEQIQFQPVEYLTLSGVRLTKLDCILPLVVNSLSLKSLDLSYNQFPYQKSGSPLDSLCLSLCQSRSIRKLNLSFNKLGSYAIKCLAHFFTFTMTIIDVDLSFTQINGEEDILALYEGVANA
jgi:hypothetical protein